MKEGGVLSGRVDQRRRWRWCRARGANLDGKDERPGWGMSERRPSANRRVTRCGSTSAPRGLGAPAEDNTSIPVEACMRTLLQPVTSTGLPKQLLSFFSQAVVFGGSVLGVFLPRGNEYVDGNAIHDHYRASAYISSAATACAFFGVPQHFAKRKSLICINKVSKSHIPFFRRTVYRVCPWKGRWHGCLSLFTSILTNYR